MSSNGEKQNGNPCLVVSPATPQSTGLETITQRRGEASQQPSQLKRTVIAVAVDDDAQVRRVTRRIAGRFVQDVREAGNSSEAETVIAEIKKTFSDAGILVITDVNMSYEGEGFDLYSKLKDDLNVRVILVSGGYPEKKMGEVGLTPEDIVDKPFDVNTLTTLICDKIRQLQE
ncbi:response regulator [Candidatus Micrarchaeota archaeon]|nr:response regulator [Candidatus Micrarchaeota archaeon]